jgi:hypothetical protein
MSSPRTAALLAWLATFAEEEGELTPTGLADIRNGRLLARVFARVSEGRFDVPPPSPLGNGDAATDVLAKNTLRRLAVALREFYAQTGIGEEGADILVDPSLGEQ